MEDKIRLLIIEANIMVAAPLQSYFEKAGFLVEVVPNGKLALKNIEQQYPEAILLDPFLPDTDGFELCRNLRASYSTAQLPILLIMLQNDRTSRLRGFECGADGCYGIYIGKDDRILVDIDELRLNIRNLLRTNGNYARDPLTDLPLVSNFIIEAELHRRTNQNAWALLELSLYPFDLFEANQGFLAADHVLRFTADLIQNVLADLRIFDNFCGHSGENVFTVIIPENKATEAISKLREQFYQRLPDLWTFLEQEQGLALEKPLSTEPASSALQLTIGKVLSSERAFTDSQEILQIAAERYREDRLRVEHPQTLMEERIWQLQDSENWAVWYLHIRHFDAYQEVYEPSRVTAVTLFTQQLIVEILEKWSPKLNFVDRAAEDTFWLITSASAAAEISQQLKTDFADQILLHYDFGHKIFYESSDYGEPELPKMELAIGICLPPAGANPATILSIAKTACQPDQ